MPTNRTPQPFAIQFADLLRVELTNWRWTWRLSLVLGVGAPVGAILGLRWLLGEIDAAALGYVFAGNLTLGLIFDNQMRVGTHIEFMRFRGTFDYFASLPVSKAALLLAIAAAFFLLSLPSVLTLVVLGPLLLNLSLHPSPLLPVILPLCAMPMIGIGAMIGLLARTPAEASSAGMLVTLLMAGVGAVIIPPSRLPSWLVDIGRFSPSTYAASALRQTLLGPVTTQIWVDALVLAVFAVVAFWVVTRKLDWRQN